MRVDDGAFPGSNNSIQTQQVNPTVAGNDDWKAGVWNATGVPTLDAFRGVEQTTVMGWFKMTGKNPNPNSNTPDPNDRYNAVGLAGILSGDSDGHGVRALLELINVNGELRLVALGRRIDERGVADLRRVAGLAGPAARRASGCTSPRRSTTRPATMALYRNGKPLDGFYVTPGDPWQVDGTGTSDTLPRGIKIGGCFPQDTREQQPLQLPDGQPDVPRPRGLRRGGEAAVPPVRPLIPHFGIVRRVWHPCSREWGCPARRTTSRRRRGPAPR